MDETKWFTILIISIMLFIAVKTSIDSVAVSNCKSTAIAAHATLDVINACND